MSASGTLARLRRVQWHRMAIAALVVWAGGLVLAAIQLDAWRSELTRTLVQLNADAQFRHRLAGGRASVDPQWYRRKALALLAANDRLHGSSTWTLFVPGSWQPFDDLTQRLAARIEREFGEIVVETIRHELLAQARELTGSGAAGASACTVPAPPARTRPLSAAPQDLAEYIAVREYLHRLEGLDAAVQAFLSLQRTGTAGPEQMRMLVRFTLGTDLPVNLAHSAALFQDRDEVALQPALLQAGLSGAARCALFKGMDALHTRLLSANELLALEEALVRSSTGLFDGGRPPVFAAQLERFKAISALLEDQDSLLGRGHNAWMRHGSRHFGPEYDALLEHVRRIGLLGPDVETQLIAHAQEAFMGFRIQFDRAFSAAPGGGIVWLERERRFALAPERTALRQGLRVLLQQPFMQEEPPAALQEAAPASDLGVQEAAGWLQMRQQFLANALPALPAFARPAVAQLVDARIADLVYRRAYLALKDTAVAGGDSGGAPFNAQAYRERAPQVAALQRTLREVGAHHLSARLGALHLEPVLRQLAGAQKQWEHSVLYQPQAGDFAWWQGEAAPLWRGLGIADPAAVASAFAQQLAELEALAAQVAPVLSAAERELASQPQMQRWARLIHELGLWRSRDPAGSFVRLEHYLVALGSDLRPDNCAQRLAAQTPPQDDHEVALRYVRLHAALAQRCAQLQRAGPPS
jgi:type VI secretion system protein ImpL